MYLGGFKTRHTSQAPPAAASLLLQPCCYCRFDVLRWFGSMDTEVAQNHGWIEGPVCVNNVSYSVPLQIRAKLWCLHYSDQWSPSKLWLCQAREIPARIPIRTTPGSLIHTVLYEYKVPHLLPSYRCMLEHWDVVHQHCDSIGQLETGAGAHQPLRYRKYRIGGYPFLGYTRWTK